MDNLVKVSKLSKEFFELSVHQATELLNSDRIKVKSEEQVWEGCLRWIDHCPEEKRQYIDRIIRCVILGLLGNQYFVHKVKTHEYAENNDSCRQALIETLKFHWDLETMDQKTEEMETHFLATPRLPNAILFVIGGWSGGVPTDSIECYDSKTDLWLQVNETDPTGPRAHHKLAVIGYDIYVVGGFNGNEYLSSCRCFNAVSKKWREIASMHSKRCYVSVAVLDNLIYAMGGCDGQRRQNTVERYDYVTNQWTFVSPMNCQRSDACATTLDGFIYIAGGFNGVEFLTSCEYYNPAIDQWTSVTSMHQPRSGVAVISHHGMIYALGGFSGIATLSSVEKLDPKTGVWTEMPDMINPRNSFATEIMDDMIFAIGGFNGVSAIFHVECFDESKNEWYEATDMHIYRSALGACVVQELPNIKDYVHQNRRGLIEERRQRLMRRQNMAMERTLLNVRQVFPLMIHSRENVIFEEDEED